MYFGVVPWNPRSSVPGYVVRHVSVTKTGLPPKKEKWGNNGAKQPQMASNGPRPYPGGLRLGPSRFVANRTRTVSVWSPEEPSHTPTARSAPFGAV